MRQAFELGGAPFGIWFFKGAYGEQSAPPAPRMIYRGRTMRLLLLFFTYSSRVYGNRSSRLHTRPILNFPVPMQTDTLLALRYEGFTLLAPSFEGSLDRPFSALGKVPTRSERAIPQHPNHLQVIIDIRYQYAIMFSLSRHASSAGPP
jgi:hypothetical protein